MSKSCTYRTCGNNQNVKVTGIYGGVSYLSQCYKNDMLNIEGMVDEHYSVGTHLFQNLNSYASNPWVVTFYFGNGQQFNLDFIQVKKKNGFLVIETSKRTYIINKYGDVLGNPGSSNDIDLENNVFTLNINLINQMGQNLSYVKFTYDYDQGEDPEDTSLYLQFLNPGNGCSPCTPISCDGAVGDACGIVDDQCGFEKNCGNCNPDPFPNNTCVNNICVCNRSGCPRLKDGDRCGRLPNGCGGETRYCNCNQHPNSTCKNNICVCDPVSVECDGTIGSACDTTINNRCGGDYKDCGSCYTGLRCDQSNKTCAPMDGNRVCMYDYHGNFVDLKNNNEPCQIHFVEHKLVGDVYFDKYTVLCEPPPPNIPTIFFIYMSGYKCYEQDSANRTSLHNFVTNSFDQRTSDKIIHDRDNIYIVDGSNTFNIKRRLKRV